MKSAIPKEVKVTDELIKDLDEGKIAMVDLAKENPELFKAVGQHLDNTEPAEAQADEVEKVPEEVPPKGFVEGKKYKEAADKASDFENKWKADQRRLKELQDKLAEKEKAPIQAPTADKVWTDDHQIDVGRRIAELEQKIELVTKSERAQLERDRAELREQLDDSELKVLGSKFKDLETSEPFSKMEARYADFYYAVAGTNEDGTAKDPSAVTRFFKDEAFRKEAEAKGVKAPADFEKINTLLQIKALRDKYQAVDPDFNLRKAHALFLAENNKLDSMLTEAELNGAKKIADKLHSSANETITMQPGLTSDTTQDSMSEAQMVKWLDEHPHPKTRDEIRTFKRISEIIDARG